MSVGRPHAFGGLRRHATESYGEYRFFIGLAIGGALSAAMWIAFIVWVLA